MKAKVDKVHFYTLVNVPHGLNDLKIKADDLDVDKLKTVLIHLKKLTDKIDNEVFKNTIFNTLKTYILWTLMLWKHLIKNVCIFFMLI